MRRRVVVTGMGCVTPLGCDVDSMWKRLLAGESGVGYTTLFDASNFPSKISAEVRDWDLSEVGLDPADWKHQGRHTHFAVGSGLKAVADSGLKDATIDPTRFGVYTGSGEGQQDFGRFTEMMVAGLAGGDFDVAEFTKKGLEILHPIRELEQEPNMPAAHLASLFNAQGPNINCLTACAASSQAIGEAVEIIRRGEADLMLAGGTHTMIHPFGVTGFNLLTVETARARGARIHCELIGYGSTADAFRITDTHPEGRGAISCIRMAIADAQLNLDEIHYINAHGTSTTVNDRVESLAVKQVFGERAYRIPVSSTKSMMGHLIAAAGATELIICILALRDNVVPPTTNYETPDPECDLDYVPNSAREVRCENVLTNSFGFGGQNISLIAQRFTD